tara:strand:+ start:16801 stop:17316 length:516 start_codon:yes stop_codon:yes gene_type:complete
MALFGGERDVSLFRNLNKELINNFIDTRVDIFKSSVVETKENLYGESLNKVFFPAVRVGGMIETEDQEWEADEFGSDYGRNAKFSFLRDTLNDIANLFIEGGDIIHWDDKYWEVDSVTSTDYWTGKNPDTDYTGGTHGWNVGVFCNTHETRRSTVNLEKVRSGYTGLAKNI